jgi:hypothetical protein
MLSENPIIRKKKFKSLRFLAGMIYFMGGLSIIFGVTIPFLMEEMNLVYLLSGVFGGIFLIYLSEIANILLEIEHNTRN